MRLSRLLSLGLLLPAALLLAPLLAAPLSAADKPTPAPRTAPLPNIKAAWLVNFAKYTTWPEGTFPTAETPVIIGILGPPTFVALTAQTAQAMPAARRIEVRAISTLDEALQCQIVYITADERKNEAAWLADLKGKPIVTIGESGQTISRGGLLEFVVVQNSLKFDASWPAMEAAGVKFRSDMLQVARTVVGRSEKPGIR